MLPQKTIVFLNSEINTTFEGISLSVNRFTKTVDRDPWQIDAHAHLNFELHYIFDGSGKIGLGNNEFLVKKGQFYICSPFVDHSQYCSEKDPMKEYCIECKLDFPGDSNNETESMFFEQLTKYMFYCIYEDTNGVLLSNFRMLDSLLENKDGKLQSGDSTMIKSLLMNTVLSMLILTRNASDLTSSAHNWNDINFHRATAIRNYLEANYKNDISIKDCARVFFMSERQIDRTLLKVFHETFHSLLMHIRVDIAVNRIKTTSQSMDNIALESGFTGYRQMLRSFNKYNVDKPTSIRKSERGAAENKIN